MFPPTVLSLMRSADCSRPPSPDDGTSPQPDLRDERRKMRTEPLGGPLPVKLRKTGSATSVNIKYPNPTGIMALRSTENGEQVKNKQ